MNWVKQPTSKQISSLQNGLAIIVDGDTCATAVPAGGYAYIKNNTHGLTDGLYKNTSGSAFPTSGGTASSSIFTAEPTGGLNALNSKMTVQTINLSASVSYSSFTPTVCKYGNIVIGSISIVTTQAVNDQSTFITGFPAPRQNPQLPVWEYGNPNCNKRVSILASGEMQPWWNSSPGLPAGNYVIPIYYVSSN